MVGCRRRIFFRFSIFIQLVLLTNAQDPFWTQICFTRANYTQNSLYRPNLDNVLFNLTSTNNGYGFYNSSSGSGTGPDTANAIALCRGDIKPDTCQRCVDDATRQLRQVCPTEVEAVGWYDNCFLRYTNRTILGNLATEVSGYTLYALNTNNVSENNVDQLSSLLGSLFETLRGEAALGGSLRKYAVGNTTGEVGSFTQMYGMVQCTPDLSGTQCNQCLEEAFGEIQACCRTRIGGRVYKPSCILRYETYIFFNDTWFPPSPPPLPPGNKKTNIALIVGPTLAAAAAVAAAVLFSFMFKRHCRKRRWDDLLPESVAPSSIHSGDGSSHGRDDGDTGEMNYFTLATIQAATNNFSLANKLGEGGFGPVYKGKLNDGKEIAVKRLSRNSGQGLEEFKTEVRLIIKLQHKNLVRLLGWCIKGHERLLVYEYMANTSLDAFLFDPFKSKELDWAKRANIVSGIAKGLRYLHEDSRLKIIHRDMKVSNVLLDDEMNAKISDFGTARIFGVNQIEALTNRVVGTYGYMAPEYAMEGLFSTKSDVYSFGVLLLEIICGQKNSKFYHQDQAQNLLSYAWRLWKEGIAEQLIDRNLTDNCPVSEALRWINIALLCVQEDPQVRPTMSSVVFMLEGQLASVPQPSEPPSSYAKFLISDQSSTTGAGTGFPSTSQTSTTASS